MNPLKEWYHDTVEKDIAKVQQDRRKIEVLKEEVPACGGFLSLRGRVKQAVDEHKAEAQRLAKEEAQKKGTGKVE